MLPLCRQILQADTQTYCNGVIGLWRTGWGAIACYPEGYWEAPISTHKTPAIISMMPKHIKSVRGSLKRKRLIIAASATPADRKSTRLNSSHVSISYAVFCLKKKNKTK